MGRLSIAVMAHESRRPLWEPLVENVGHQGRFGTTAFVDDGTLGRWGNGRRCLLNYDPEATHHLVIQDDAVPCLDLVEGLEAVLENLPEAILCLYSGKVRSWRNIHDVKAEPPCWLQMKQIQWGPALVLPTRCIDLLVATGDRMPRIGNYDLRLSEANLRTYNLPVLVPSPSWVDHEYVESTVPGRKPNRHALHAIPRDVSALEIFDPEVPPRIIKVAEFHRQPNGQHFYRGRPLP